MENKNNNNNSGSNFFGGFLLGFLVGASVVFLFGTKKGKKLLKTISEEGIDNISNLLEEASKTEDLNEDLEENPSVQPSSSFQSADNIPEGQEKNFTQKKEEPAVKERPIEEMPKVRRFFRGISRRVN